LCGRLLQNKKEKKKRLVEEFLFTLHCAFQLSFSFL
jgi:hypothetical protein